MKARDSRLHLRALAARTVKRIGYHTPLQRLLFHQYDYMFTPGQLGFLCECVRDTAALEGPVVEIGCAGGSTTVFLCRHLDEIGSPRRYVCLDTFAGFTEADIAVERARGKTAAYEAVFTAYARDYFLRTLQNNGVTRPEVVCADVNEFDFGAFEDVSFCLVDVDLYRPVQRCLAEIVPRMVSGGIVVVDDCSPDNDYDGALQAYTEFVDEHEIKHEIQWGKLGVIRIA
jgi:O-methyltransferase